MLLVTTMSPCLTCWFLTYFPENVGRSFLWPIKMWKLKNNFGWSYCSSPFARLFCCHCCLHDIMLVLVIVVCLNVLSWLMISSGEPPGRTLLVCAQTSDSSPGETRSLVPHSARKRASWPLRRVIVCQGSIKGKVQQGKQRGVLGFQERQTVISKCFFALSGCLTKAAGEFEWRIRLVAFLWPLTSGGFGLCLDSQWSNRHVCCLVERSIDCGLENNAFFPRTEGC